MLPQFDRSYHRFQNRREAGRVLGSQLMKYAGRDDVVILALPRGGVPVAFEVARALRAPLDVFVVRKLGVPGHRELAMGALASGGVRMVDQDIIRALDISDDEVRGVEREEQREIERLERVLRNDRPPTDLTGRVVILVDDGLATGSTMRAAAAALELQKPAKIVAAVPVASSETCDEFRDEVDEVVCATTPEPFFAVGMWYTDFSQTTDDEVRQLLAQATEGP